MIEIYENGRFRPIAGRTVNKEILVDDACMYYIDDDSISYNNWHVIGGDYGALRITLLSPGTITLTSNDTFKLDSIQYRTTNNPYWCLYDVGTSIDLDSDDWVEFWNTDEIFSLDPSNYLHFVCTTTVRITGRITSLLDYSTSCSPYCFYRLFEGIHTDNLPILDVDTLAPYCFAYMFKDNESLLYVPSNLLPVKELADGCYCGMFMNSKALVNSPDLPALVGVPYCYADMFNGCTTLGSISVLLEQWGEDNNYTTRWVDGVTTTNGICIKRNCLPVIYDETHIPKNWNWDYAEPLSVKLQGTGQFSLTFNNTADTIELLVRLNGGEWLPVTKTAYWDVQGTTEFELYNRHRTLSTGKDNYVTISSTLPLSIKGSLDALQDHYTECGAYTFAKLFYSANINAFDVQWPTALAPWCFYQMFAHAIIEDMIINSVNYAIVEEHSCDGMFLNSVVKHTNVELELDTRLVKSQGFYQFLAGSNITNFNLRMTKINSLDTQACAELAKDCIQLQEASVVVASAAENVLSVAERALYGAFENCGKLVKAKLDIPSNISFGNEALGRLYYQCKKLKDITVYLYSWQPDILLTNDWVYGVNLKGGKFQKPDNLIDRVREFSYIPKDWYIIPLFYDENYISLDAYIPPNSSDITIKRTELEPNSHISLDCRGIPELWFYYKVTEDSDWISFEYRNQIPLCVIWDTVQIKGETDFERYPNAKKYWGILYGVTVQVVGGLCRLFGDLSRFWQSDDKPTEYTYKELFKGSTGIVDASQLYFKSQGITGEFYGLFSDCMNLKYAPACIHEVLADENFAFCYTNCRSLEEAPRLVGNVAYTSSCISLCENCITLTSTGNIPFKFVEPYALKSAFSGCINIKEPVTLSFMDTETYFNSFSFSLHTHTGADLHPFASLVGIYICINRSVPQNARQWQKFDGSYTVKFVESRLCVTDDAGRVLAYSWNLTDWTLTSVLGDPSGVELNGYINVGYANISAMFKGCKNIETIICKYPLMLSSQGFTNWLNGAGTATEYPVIYLRYGCTYSDLVESSDKQLDAPATFRKDCFRTAEGIPANWNILFYLPDAEDNDEEDNSSCYVAYTVLYTNYLTVVASADYGYYGEEVRNLHVEGNCLYFDK